MASTPLLLFFLLLIRPFNAINHAPFSPCCSSLTVLLILLIYILYIYSISSLSFSMTPLYDLNQPPPSFPVVEDQRLQLFLPPRDHHAAAFSGPAFFNTTYQDQTGSNKLSEESSYLDDHKVDKFFSLSSSRDHTLFSPSSSFQVAIDAQKLSSSKRENEDYYERSGDGSDKWMPSKMRIIQKMMNSNCSESNNKPVNFTIKFEDHKKHEADNNEINSSFSNSNGNNIRVCSDCNTTTTPLWRSGPRGPKSLCNACGIRQRKARRAMAAAAAAAVGNGAVSAMETSSSSSSSTKTKVKEKKPRTSHCKKLFKALDHSHHNNHGQKAKISFKNIALSLSKNSALQRVLPQDVEEAAILLMELSCGLIHS